MSLHAVLADDEQVTRLAERDVPVLIVGSRGTRKLDVARAIHEASRRRLAAFTPFDMSGTVPLQFVEAELFGSTRGGFTGRAVPRPGLCEGANGGTVFLDHTPVLFMNKLSRAITGRVQRLGEREEARSTCASFRTNPTGFRRSRAFYAPMEIVRLPQLEVPF